METYTYKLVEDEHGNIQCGDKLYRFEETIKYGGYMKITIYELLGMVKDGKELPKLENEVEKDFSYYVYDKWGDTCNLEDLKKILNNEVEILEEEKKALTLNDIRESYGLPRIEEKKIPEKFKVHSFGDKDENGNFVSNPFPTNEEFMNKINEIIDYLKSKGE